ncbi:unnamed protein product [Paramecium octaurelia]|uniref:Uncharacterized protein n=1 Tax=Paramecium octaurelia TaxID=43137 RepID=A0A8S1WGS5_PAROT|nr:unnamed protein product [Paramecium octaurelia]
MQQYHRTFNSKAPDRNLIVRSTLKLPQISIGMMNIPTRSSEHIRSSRLHTKTKTFVKPKERPQFKQFPTEKTMLTLGSLNSPRSEDEGESTHKSQFSFRRTLIDTLSLRQSRKTSLERDKQIEDNKQVRIENDKSSDKQALEEEVKDPTLDEPEIRPKKESQSIRPKNESVSSQFTQLTDEIHSVWDNMDLYLRGVQFDDFDHQNQLQSFLQLYKMRSGGFPGAKENLQNEEVIRRAVEYAKGNRQVFKKYFPTKQVVFENDEDYTQNYDVNADPNFRKFHIYLKNYNQQS